MVLLLTTQNTPAPSFDGGAVPAGSVMTVTEQVCTTPKFHVLSAAPGGVFIPVSISDSVLPKKGAAAQVVVEVLLQDAFGRTTIVAMTAKDLVAACKMRGSRAGRVGVSAVTGASYQDAGRGLECA